LNECCAFSLSRSFNQGLENKGERVMATFGGLNEEYVLAGGENAHVLFFDTTASQTAPIFRHPLQMNGDVCSACVPHPTARSLAFAATTVDGKVTFYSE
jgi:hypothetical protein